MGALIFDSRRRSCYAIMVNSFYVHETVKELLTTFEATSQLLWTWRCQVFLMRARMEGISNLIVLGYSSESKAGNLQSNKIVDSRDVVFDETQPFWGEFSVTRKEQATHSTDGQTFPQYKFRTHSLFSIASELRRHQYGCILNRSRGEQRKDSILREKNPR